MTEDEVKEIAAKICHEKMKNLYEHIKEKISSEIRFEIRSGKIRFENFLSDDESSILKKRIDSECISYMNAVLREAFTKFMKSVNS